MKKQWHNIVLFIMVLTLAFAFGNSKDVLASVYHSSTDQTSAEGGYNWSMNYTNTEGNNNFALRDYGMNPLTVAKGTSCVRVNDFYTISSGSPSDYRFSWSSNNGNVMVPVSASTTSDGVSTITGTTAIQGRSVGTATLTGNVINTTTNQVVYTITKSIKITDPYVNSKLAVKRWVSEKGDDIQVVKGSNVSYATSRIRFGVKASSFLDNYLSYTDSKGFVLRIAAVFNENVIVEVDGKQFKVRITSYLPMINGKTAYRGGNLDYLSEYLYTNSSRKTKKLKVTKVPSGMKISFSSGSKKKMSVKRLSKSKARIKAKKKGTTYVKIKVGSYYIKEKVKIYHLKSSVDKAIKQAKSFRKRKIKYSQPKRMMKNYADCSSFVWRSYRKGRVYIGSHSYAPTAASMAKTLSRKKRVIGYKKAKISKMKPGDLIFCTGAKNGRYRGIYHVQMYLGGNEIIDVNGYYQHFGGKYIRGMIARPVR